MTGTPRVCVLACGVLARDIRALSRKLGLDLELRFLPGGLHDRPDHLRGRLQDFIDEADRVGTWDRIVIGYGVCGLGTVSIHSRSLTLVLPQVHDCIALFLGSDAAYQAEFRRCPGTYYISAGWHDEKTEPLSQREKYAYAGHQRIEYDELVRKQGQKQADRTFAFLNSWRRNYQRAAFIDTGNNSDQRSADYAREMAARYGWRFESLAGDLGLLTRLLTVTTSGQGVVVVPPGQVTVFNPIEGGLSSRPVLEENETEDSAPNREWVEGAESPASDLLRLGLGIDAGGTYTDAVVYDFSRSEVRGKNKALTTKWDFSLGIGQALAGLDPELLAQVQMVAVSTTLATNAIVEGDGQKVGLLIMPPYGIFDEKDIAHQPTAVLAGQLDIDGRVIAPLDEDQIRRSARRMVDLQGVEAFAVSGYAGSINPEHELEVKRIVREETGCFVSCGHELSSLLNFQTRALTAVLNARIVPRLLRLLDDVARVLKSRSVAAPIMVVRGDGTLMSTELAGERPVETILSGPAASVAGARFLTNLDEALVVDMGGTTTDTAAVSLGRVEASPSGCRVGGVQTHVRALKIMTTGLGGDSLISWEDGTMTIGPRRVTPVAWLGHHFSGLDRTLAYLGRKLPVFHQSSQRLQILALTGAEPTLELDEREKLIIESLRSRPLSLDELSDRIGAVHPGTMPVDRLEARHLIHRCALTPTDVLHATGQFTRWNAALAREVLGLLATVARLDPEELAGRIMDEVVARLTMELIMKQVTPDERPVHVGDSDLGRVFLDSLFGRGGRDFVVRFMLRRPIVGLGAPIVYFLPRAARLLETEAIMPPDGDVANAIGAITSHVAVSRQMAIKPGERGGYYVDGLTGADEYPDLRSAQERAVAELTRQVRDLARRAGTSQTQVHLKVEDQTAPTARGEVIFLERRIKAGLEGSPDLLLASPDSAAAVDGR